MGKCSLFAWHCDIICCGSYGKFDFCSIGSTALQLPDIAFFPFWVITCRNKITLSDRCSSYRSMYSILSWIMSTVLLSWGWCSSAPHTLHLSRQLAKLSWLINNHAMVVDQRTSNVLRLSALFLLCLYCTWLRKCGGGVGSFHRLSACL